MLQYMVIGLGGALGAITRVALGKLLPVSIMGIPFQILFVNILGCFVMGLLTEIMLLRWPVTDNLRSFWISGVLGGFTTFSSFALEFGLLLKKNEIISAMIYATLSFAVSIIFFFIGIKLARIS